MLEILVSLLVISIGMLGTAGLASATFSYNKTAQVRLVGLGLAHEYADRARINVYGYDLGEYDIAHKAAKPTAPTQNAGELNPKTAAENVARQDRIDFLTAVADRLPQGEAVVVSTRSASARDLDIWLVWQEPNTSGDSNFFADACPTGLGDSTNAVTGAIVQNTTNYSCMYFKVGL